MKSTKTIVSKNNIEDYSGDLLVTFVGQDKKGKAVGEEQIISLLDSLKQFDEFSGKKEESIQLYPPFGDLSASLKCKRLLLVGLGKIAEENTTSNIAEILRSAGGIISNQCKKSKCETIAVVLPERKGTDPVSVAEWLAEGLLLGDYQFLKYKKKPEDEKQYPGFKKVEFLTSGNVVKIRKGITRAVNSSTSACDARDMANEPGNGWTPGHFAKYARKLAKTHGLKCTVLGKTDMVKIGMGGILAVNQGSKEAPKCIILDYNPGKTKDTILMVGKGLTFDSGGVSLKPSAGMMDMKYDMCGGAAVISAMEAIAREKPDVRVVAIVPSTDNMPGGGALKPGDIITHYGGITSEIENTDAEGRLILADALGYGIEKFNPTCVVDLATLTGAVIFGLGHHYSGLMSNNDTLAEHLIDSATICGEPLWRLPLSEDYAKQIASQVADVKNTGGKAAGTITAAEYLHKFVGDTPWAHLDIAGTAWNFTEKSYIPKGPSGFGVRTLVQFVRNWTSGQIKGDKD